MTAFARHLQSDGSTRWWQADPGRYVASEQCDLAAWLAAGGVPDVVPYVAPPVPTLAQIKATATEANRAECRSRILARWDENKQRSAALGVYPPAECDACADWIASNIAAENTAADAIDAATDAAGVAAVVVNWPA